MSSLTVSLSKPQPLKGQYSIRLYAQKRPKKLASPPHLEAPKRFNPVQSVNNAIIRFFK
ncbi:hypothetical protein [Bartonella sp. ML70XJBT]|uniref:hypothetical protein n=1 Tax=Bartonella sp. ML70XJBT TaxID=3019096 RepID=UPI00236104E2|nr:hypothetical protein [Bartonella sp. ML70XJBT]